MKVFLSTLTLVLILAIQGFSVELPASSTSPTSGPSPKLAGEWRVKFILPGGIEKNLIFKSKPKGIGSFRLLDTGPDNKPVAEPQVAVWSELTNERVSFSGEAELPLGTCCREIGTLIFKGKFTADNSISGKLLFVTSVDEAENPFQYRSLIGTFTATRMK